MAKALILDPLIKKRVSLIRFTSLFFSGTIAVFVILFTSLKLPITAWFSVFFSLILLTPLYFIRKQQYTMAALLLLLLSNLLGLGMSLLVGRETGIDKGFYVLAGAPWVLFDLRKTKLIFFSFSLTIAGYATVQWSGLDIAENHNLSESAKSLLHLISSMLFLSMIFSLVFYLSRENKKAESELGKVITDLKEEQLQKEILHRQLEEQRGQSLHVAKMASLGEMAGGIAHEINNPLAIINVLSGQLGELIAETPLDSKAVTEVTQTIEKTTLRIAEIIRGLRSFSRDGSKDKFSSVSVQSVIKDTLVFCSEKFKEMGVKLIVEDISPQLHITCRPVQISQVILNLLNNALDAISGLDEKWVKLSTTDLGDRVEIIVEDSGKGIPSEIQEKLFQPFFTTKDINKGTGLGLSVSLGLIKSNQGELILDKNSANTRFCILLPKSLV